MNYKIKELKDLKELKEFKIGRDSNADDVIIIKLIEDLFECHEEIERL